jgi:hypothetical protein
MLFCGTSLLTNPNVVIAHFKGFKAGFVTEQFAKLEIRKPPNKLLVNVMNIKDAMLIHFP